jgi:hypothetical protein
MHVQLQLESDDHARVYTFTRGPLSSDSLKDLISKGQP